MYLSSNNNSLRRLCSDDEDFKSKSNEMSTFSHDCLSSQLIHHSKGKTFPKL